MSTTARLEPQTESSAAQTEMGEGRRRSGGGGLGGGLTLAQLQCFSRLFEVYSTFSSQLRLSALTNNIQGHSGGVEVGGGGGDNKKSFRKNKQVWN